jgi:hypothetical protein
MMSAILRGYSCGLEITTHERKPAEILRKPAQRGDGVKSRSAASSNTNSALSYAFAVARSAKISPSATVECATTTTVPPPDRL